jgi:two-component system NtrC family sensor kinase
LLESAAKELDRVARITKQSLSFHRDTDKPIEIDLGELLGDVIGMMDRTAAVHRVRLTVQRQPVGKVRGFPGQLVQVFSNLIRNAIEVSPAGSEVTVRLHAVRRRGAGGCRVTIHDRGAGIPLEIRDNIFDPFFTTKQLRGSGLGLWVSKSLVTRHRGTIRFRSCQLQGRSGTTFEIYLPSMVSVRQSPEEAV